MKLQNIKIKEYNYMVMGDCSRKLPFFPLEPINERYYSFSLDGIFTLKLGYMFDGCSGVAIDGEHNLEACAFHDGLFQAMRERKLPENYFDLANKVFYDILVEKGFNKFRAWCYWKAVGIFGKKFATPK